MTLSQITQTLGDAIPAENLTGLAGDRGPSFGAQTLGFLTVSNGDTAGLFEVSIGLGTAEDEQDGLPVTMKIADVAGGGAGAGNPLANYDGMLPGHCRTALSFAYARAAQPGEEPNYQPGWPTGGWPDLVRITLTLTLDETPEQPLVFQTAVIPGRIARAARPVPSTTPSPTATPAPQPTPQPTPEPTPEPVLPDATPTQTEDQG
jgi:hypothetical protein